MAEPAERLAPKVREKITWKPGTMLYPVPAVLVSCQGEQGPPNLITIAWAATVCTEPPMVAIGVRPERYSYKLIRESGEFVINLPDRSLARATDFCGCKSGKNLDKFAQLGLTAVPGEVVKTPILGEAPLSLECRLQQVLHLGSHHLMIGEVVAVRVDPTLLDAKGKLHLEKADLIAYSHGQYMTLGKTLGQFGFSVQKKRG